MRRLGEAFAHLLAERDRVELLIDLLNEGLFAVD
jgi:hypothetical protein